MKNLTPLTNLTYLTNLTNLINFTDLTDLKISSTNFLSQVEKILEQLGKEYRGDRYHLMNRSVLFRINRCSCAMIANCAILVVSYIPPRNCNHFSGAFSQILTGR